MEIENAFEVPATPQRVWDFLLDVGQVVPCMPGAQLTETVDERTWKAKMTVKLGPVTLSYAGDVVIDSRDEANQRVVMKATGTETRGKGVASAVVTSHLLPSDNGTLVAVLTDLSISGAAAQYGRGMIVDVSQRLTDEFAKCLAARLAAPESPGGAPAGEDLRAVEPISGLSLASWALGRAFLRNLNRGWRAVTSPFR